MSSEQKIGSVSNCEAVRELIPDYAFGLTDAEQNRFVEAHLPLCAEAAAELAEFRQIQAEMRADVEQIEPPLSLEAKLMAAIAEPVPTTAAPASEAPALAVAPLTNQPRRRVIPFGWLAAAAAVILLVLSNGYWLGRVNDLNEEKAQLAGQLVADNGTDTPAFILTSTSGLRWVRLPPAEEAADTSAFLMWNAESKIGLLYAHGFPELAVGKTYQLWLTRGETRKSVGTFRVDEEGTGALLFMSEEPIDQFTWARITDEPENGSPQPTGPIVVIGKLST